MITVTTMTVIETNASAQAICGLNIEIMTTGQAIIKMQAIIEKYTQSIIENHAQLRSILRP